MDAIKALQNWYKSNCNGDWEHSYGVEIGTLDNPGWSIKISLTDTDWEDTTFNCIDIQRQNEDDWLHCKVEDKVFTGYGGPVNLEEIIEVFISWVSET